MEIISTGTVVSIILSLSFYNLILFLMDVHFAKIIKLILYIFTFISLFTPSKVIFGGMIINIYLYAIILMAIEIEEQIIKLILDDKIRRKKRISKKIIKIYKYI